MNTYYSREAREDYAPPFLGNGDIAFAVDAEAKKKKGERKRSRRR